MKDLTIAGVQFHSEYANKKANLKRIEKLWDAKPGTSRGDELDILSTLVEKYEENNFKLADIQNRRNENNHMEDINDV